MAQDRDERAAAIQAGIGYVLLHDCDPIGIQDIPEAQDEYHSYVDGLYRLLASAAASPQIADHLCAIEQERMGLPPNRLRASRVADKLRELDLRLRQ
jgi:hypothetical protein